MSALPWFPAGARVQSVPVPESVGTIIPLAEWPFAYPEEWTDENTVIIRWDAADGAKPGLTVLSPAAAVEALRVLEPASEPIYLALDGAVMKRHSTDPDLEDLRDAGWDEIDAPEQDDDGTEAGSLAEVSVPAFPDVLVHGRAAEPLQAHGGLMSVMTS